MVNGDTAITVEFNDLCLPQMLQCCINCINYMFSWHCNLLLILRNIRNNLLLSSNLVIFTDRVRSTREGYVLTRICTSVCLSTGGGGTPTRSDRGGVSWPGLDWGGTPAKCDGGVLSSNLVIFTDHVSSMREGYVLTHVCTSVSLSTGWYPTWPGGYPSQVQLGGTPTKSDRGGVPWPGLDLGGGAVPQPSLMGGTQWVGGTLVSSDGGYPGQVWQGVPKVGYPCQLWQRGTPARSNGGYPRWGTPRPDGN